MKKLSSFFKGVKEDCPICLLGLLFGMGILLFVAGMLLSAFGGFMLGKYTMDSIQDDKSLSNAIAIIATFVGELLFCFLCIAPIIMGRITYDSYQARNANRSLTV